MPPSSNLERVYDEHAKALFAFLLDFTGSESDTRDLLQELFIRLAAKESMFHSVSSERAYLIRLAHNMAVDFLRRSSVRKRKHEEFGAHWVESDQGSRGPDNLTFEEAVSRALQTLPPEQRGVVHLKLWGGATFSEIAAALDISLNTAASRYRYGIDKLREQLRPLYDEIQ